MMIPVGRIRFATAFSLLTACLGGCTDFASPAELSHPQILAVRADPPAVAAGQRARLSVLVAGPSGRIAPSAITWTGSVEQSEGDWWYVAPASAPPGGTLDTFEVTVQLADGGELSAVKVISVGMPTSAANPIIRALIADGEPLDEGAPRLVRAGETVGLDAEVEPAPGPNARFSWYMTEGEIELYRRTPTELIVGEAPAEAALFVVYRDGSGGVAWREAALHIE